MDLRSHGQSETGLWSLTSLLADIDRVCRHYEFTNVVIAGHSLGGILAHLSSEKTSSVSAVINLDGFSLRFDEYVGFDEESVRRRMKRRWRDYVATTNEPITPTIRGLMDLYWELSSSKSLFDIIAAVECPSLIVNAVSSGERPALAACEQEFLDAYSRGIAGGLSRLSNCSHVLIEEITADHLTLLDDVDGMTSRIRQFLR